MKSLLRIYRRYIFSALWIAGMVICVNLVVFLSVQAVIRSWNEESGFSVLRSQLNRVAAALSTDEEGQISLGADGEAALAEAEAQFAFLLSDDGTRIWGWNLPEGIQEHYTVGEVASFSRWYLMDYPVRVWNCEQGLLVVANSRESVAKYSVEYSRSTLQNVPFFILAVLGANLLLILILAVLSGYRLYEGLRPIAFGLDRLVDGRRIAVPENGIARDLAEKLNQVSRILEIQRQNLNQRDTARTEWISGVSHDIRTPLSMVMGYADSLENDATLPLEARKEAGIIREQSLKIKTLIEDLNLTSKLEYHMQPLRVKDFMPAALLRQAVVSILNGGGQGSCELETDIDDALEPVVMRGDEALLSRALQNLIGNSIRHNPGCWNEKTGKASACSASGMTEAESPKRYAGSWRGCARQTRMARTSWDCALSARSRPPTADRCGFPQTGGRCFCIFRQPERWKKRKGRSRNGGRFCGTEKEGRDGDKGLRLLAVRCPSNIRMSVQASLPIHTDA